MRNTELLRWCLARGFAGVRCRKPHDDRAVFGAARRVSRLNVVLTARNVPEFDGDAALYAVVLATASCDRTSSWGASGVRGWGMAMRVKLAIAPGRKTRQ